MDNSMEERFVDRLLHALAEMSEYAPALPVAAKTAEKSPPTAAGEPPTTH
ncbi:MAG: hypothetical protein R3F18_00520 [Lysobacterales bacterium]|nr:hypothetical protein [Xanthomonadales bacterium]MCB1612956.1 hypothetical protein [Xanthomonadales bacterium]